MRFTGETLYSVPATLNNTTDVNAIGFTSGATMNERGVWIRDNVLEINTPVRATSGTAPGTLTYSDPTGTPFYFVSYTDRVTDGNYRRDFVRSGVTATGFPNNYDEIASEVDPFIQGVAIGDVPVSSVGQTTVNGNYRQVIRNIYNSTALIDRSTIITSYQTSGFTTPYQVSLSDTSNTSVNTGSSLLTFRLATNGAFTADTATGMINAITSTNATTGFNLDGHIVDGVSLNATAGNILSPHTFASFRSDLTTDYSFRNLVLDGTMVVDAPADVYVTFSGVTSSSGLTINRGSGSGTVFIQGITAGGNITFGANVETPMLATHPVVVNLSVPTGLSWALYTGSNTAPTFSSFNGDAITSVSSAAGTNQIAGLGTTVTDLYLMVGNITNAVRVDKLVVSDPMTPADQPTPTAPVLRGREALQNIDTTSADVVFGAGQSSTTIAVGNDAAITQSGTFVLPSGTAVVDIEGFNGANQAFEGKTELIWATARNTLNWFNAIRTIRENEDIYSGLASGAGDNYDLFLPNGAGGIVKNVFLTDRTATISADGIQIITGTQYSGDRSTGFTVATDAATARLAVHVLTTGSMDRQIIIQQPSITPGVATAAELTTRGLTRQNLVNLGVGAPIIQADGTGLDTSFSTTES